MSLGFYRRATLARSVWNEKGNANWSKNKKTLQRLPRLQRNRGQEGPSKFLDASLREPRGVRCEEEASALRGSGGGGVWEKGGSHKMLEGKKIIVLEEDDEQLKFW